MPALNFEQVRERLAARYGDAVGPTVAAKDPFVVVKGEKLLEVCRFLHDDPDLAFDYLIDVTAVDFPKENLLRLVYHLYSIKQRHGFKLKVECDRAAPKASSVDPIWRAANWLEREVYDLFGVAFEGHPDLRRIMMPEDWPGHPLRKDWQEVGGYHGVSNTRVSPLDQHLEQDKKARAEAAKNAPPVVQAPAAAAPAGAAAAPAGAAAVPAGTAAVPAGAAAMPAGAAAVPAGAAAVPASAAAVPAGAAAMPAGAAAMPVGAAAMPASAAAVPAGAAAVPAGAAAVPAGETGAQAPAAPAAAPEKKE